MSEPVAEVSEAEGEYTEWQVGDYVSWNADDTEHGQIERIDGEEDAVAIVVVFEGDSPTEQRADVPVAELLPWDGPATEGEDEEDDYFAQGRMDKDLGDYWTHGEGAAKIAWGTPGDFERCRTLLSEHVGPTQVSGACANLHKNAVGKWPGEKKSHSLAAAGVMAPAFTFGRAASLTTAALVASAGTVGDYLNPNLPGPTPLTITDDGRVYGHLAAWGTCHVGVADACVTPPSSPSGYAHFATGEVVLADGSRVPVGQITMDTGHADLSMGARPAAAHYDNTGAVVADVAAGEDDHGIWVAGRLRPGVSEAQRHALRAAALSGDWRRISGAMELVAALAVNVPGFAVPRTQAAVAASGQQALVASGIVAQGEPEPFSVQAVAREVARIQGRGQRRDTLVASLGLDRASRVQAARERVEG